MKKRAVMIALLLTMTIAAAGCTKNSEETTKTDVSDTTEENETEAEQDTEEADDDQEKEPTTSELMAEIDVEKCVTLGEYKGITVEKTIEPVTDDYLNEIEYLIALFYNKREIPKQILIPDEIDEIVLKEIIDTKFIKVTKGSKYKLLKMAKENAIINLENNFKRIENQISKTEGANEELEHLLGMKIKRIDIFDN